MLYKTHQTPYKTISEAILSKEGIEINSNKEFNSSVKSKYINTYWNEDNFKNINLPIIVDSLNNNEIQQYTVKEDIRVLDLPIKFPHSHYKIPAELAHLKSIIQKIIDYEANINNEINNYYCYLTLDRRMVLKDKHTRKEGIHVDGFQGSRLNQQYKVDHSYIVHSNTPTIFYNQPFDVKNHWNKSCHNYFKGFEQQKQLDKKITYDDHSILLIDAYTLHEANIVKEDTYRTFLRLSFTEREFDRLGNAHNPMFDYKWDMVSRDIQCDLITPPPLFMI